MHFSRFTSLFTDYGLPISYDFYNRFRSGEMPIAIADYTEYNRLAVSAPEIKNLWTMTHIPGTVQEDGTVNYTAVAGVGQCGMILKSSKQPEQAWKYLEWFTRNEQQVVFGRKIEMILGPSGRYATANKQAFFNLPWSQQQAMKLDEQWKQVVELRQVPGTYYVQRDIQNAFRKVVLSGRNPRETLENYQESMNVEIRRKRKEFHLSLDES